MSNCLNFKYLFEQESGPHTYIETKATVILNIIKCIKSNLKFFKKNSNFCCRNSMGRQAVQLQCKRKLIYFNYIHTTPNYPGHRFILTEMDNEII